MLWDVLESAWVRLGAAERAGRHLPRFFSWLLIALFAALATPQMATAAAAPGTLAFSFSAYGNPQRPGPGYVGPWQLGPVTLNGSGVLRLADGAILRGGVITHTDSLKDPHYPYHNTTWQVVRGWIAQAGAQITLTLQVQVTSSNLPFICPVGTYGVITAVYDKRRLPNGYAYDYVSMQAPNPASTAPSGGLACGTHNHGMNNTDIPNVDPPRGGAGGGMWANVNIDVGANPNILGMWMRTSDRSIVNFVMGRNNTVVGYIVDLGPTLGGYGFRVGEQTFSVAYAGGTTYTGQVEWRNTSGRIWWQGTRQEVNGNEMHGDVGDWVRVNAGYATAQPQQPQSPPHQDGGVFYDPPQQ